MRPCQLAELYLAYMEVQKGAAPGTIKQYTWVWSSLCSYLDQEYPDVAIADITIGILDEFLALPAIRKMATSTRCTFITAIRGGFKYAASRGYLKASPAEPLSRPRRDRLYPRCLSRENCDKVLRYIRGSDPSRPQYLDVRDRTLVALLLYSGMRRAEASSLDWDDIDFVHNEIHIRRAKGGKFRTIPLHLVLRDRLLAYREICNGGGPVFQTLHLERLMPAGITATFNRHVQPATNHKVTPHTLRHTCATFLQKAKAGILLIQRILGHADLSTTAIYVGTDAQDLQEDFQSLNFK